LIVVQGCLPLNRAVEARQRPVSGTNRSNLRSADARQLPSLWSSSTLLRLVSDTAALL